MAKGLFGSLRGVDAFGKTMEDVKVKTRMGAFLTILAAAVILAFTTIEFFDYRRVNIDTSIVVDKSRGDKLTVKLNVTFPHIPCYLLSLDVTDISGEQQRDVSHNILKARLDHQGVPIPNWANADLRSEYDKIHDQRGEDYCGSCFGGTPPENGCCNTCEEVRTSYVKRGWSFSNPDAIEQCVQEGWSDKLKEQSGEGCRISGRVRVNKVVGNLQLSPGRAFQSAGRNMNDLVPYLRTDEHKHDWTHTINEFAFMGDDEYDIYKAEVSREMKQRMGLQGNPLDNAVGKTEEPQFMFQYFLKVVSTQLRTLDGKVINTHQYSATHFERDLSTGVQGSTPEGLHLAHGVMGMPGTFLNFEISPILVVHTETRQSFAHFLTSTCAIVGGVLTIASIFDSVLFATGRALKKSGVGSSSQVNGYGKSM